MTNAPRFDLIFEGGECVARVSAPLSAGPVRVDDLALAFDVAGAIDVRGGAQRMRHTRAHLRRARVHASHHALAAAASAAGADVRLSTEGDDLRLDARDAGGCLSARIRVFCVGADVGLHVVHMSWANDTGRPAFDRLRELVLTLGVTFDATHGIFRFERPVRRALAEALVPHGWRLPDERGLGVRIRLEPGGAVVEAGVDAEPPPLEEARALASAWSGVVVADAPAWLRSAVRGGLHGPTASLRGGAPSVASLDAFFLQEPSAWVRADGALRALERATDLSPFGDAIVRSLACFPHDVALWRRWMDRLAAAGDPVVLRILDACIAGPIVRSTRSRLIADALLALVEATPELGEEEEAQLSRFAARVRRDAPTDSRAIGAFAAAAWRGGELLAAAEAFVEAADASAEASESAEWRRRGADLFLGIRGPAAAVPLLEQALVESDGDPRLVVALARVVAERGDNARADDLLGGLLRATRAPNDSLQDALLSAARFHVERGAPDRARPFLAAMHEAPPELLSSSPFATFRPQSTPTLESILDGGIPLVSWADEPANDGPSREPTGVQESRSRRLDAPRDHADESPSGPTHTQTRLPKPGGGSAPRDSASGSTLEPGRQPDVTLVSIADGDVRALLTEARLSDDPTGLLEGALEEAIEAASADGIRQVLRVLDRLDRKLPTEDGLRSRGERLLARLGEEP